MAVLALDIATTTGWAILDPRTPDRPFLGSVRFPSDPQEIGRSGVALLRFLEEREAMHGGFSDVIFEAQHAAGKIDIHVLARLLGLAAVVETWAYDAENRKDAAGRKLQRPKIYAVHIGTWRKHAFGTGRMNREEAKRRAMEECRALGFDPSNDNEAEAFFILDYYVSLQNKHGARIPQPWRDNAFFDRSGAQR
jgi:hypothetical protein